MSSTATPKSPRRTPGKRQTLGRGSESQTILRHWREAVPDDRFAHLVKDATRSFQRALQVRLVEHEVPFGHWTFLRVLWEADGLTQKQLSDEVGVMEPTTYTVVRAMELREAQQRLRGNATL